ncbi:hypothetical protein ZIOFF_016067 [Zingiber officinale]|uniref:Uncharacterized protein n=1 Tax=Zingiber officinale TaxID=94328 RepID=A0A8J5HFU7_ZINOF|nr:hypothetical protein ZIOFF_016067 [Zingiber officinale]
MASLASLSRFFSPVHLARRVAKDLLLPLNRLDVTRIYEFFWQNKFKYEKKNLVMAEVERLAMRAIREGRCKMRRHWKQLGGFGNKDSPKRKPYKGEISEKNTNNRFNRPLEGAHGSKTLVQHYHTAADPVTGELPSVIDTFEKFFHKGGQWKNDWAAQKHKTIDEQNLTIHEQDQKFEALLHQLQQVILASHSSLHQHALQFDLLHHLPRLHHRLCSYLFCNIM